MATQKKSKLIHLQEPPFSLVKKVLCRRKPFVTGLIEVQFGDEISGALCDQCLKKVDVRTTKAVKAYLDL